MNPVPALGSYLLFLFVVIILLFLSFYMLQPSNVKKICDLGYVDNDIFNRLKVKSFYLNNVFLNTERVFFF